MVDKLWNKKYVCLVFVNTLSGFSFYMIMSLLTSYLTEIGNTVSVAGLVVGLFSITSLAVRPFTGYISDNYNKKFLLILGMAVTGVSVAGYVSTGALGGLILIRVVHGTAFALVSTGIVSLASEYIPASRFNQGIGYLGLGQIISSAIGPGLGVAIMNRLDIRYSFFVAAAFAFAGVLLLALFKYKPDIRKKEFGLKLEDIICVKALNHTCIGGIYSFSNGIISSFIVLFALTKGIRDVSIYFTVCAVFLFLARPVTGKLVDRVPIKYIVYPGLLLSVVSMVILANADSMYLIILSAVLRSLAQGAVQPVLQAECIRRAGTGKSGVATSTYYLGGDIGQGIGPIVGGVLAGSLGYPSVFYACAVLFVAGVFLFYAGTRQKNLRPGRM